MVWHKLENTGYDGEQSITQSLQRRLIGYSTAGIFAVSLIMATASLLPLYQDLRAEQTESLSEAARSRATQVQLFLQQSQDIALQVTSRTQIRRQLEAYNAGEISLSELVEFSASKLLDALKLSEDIVAIARYDNQGELVVQVGEPVPEVFWVTPPAQSSELLIGQPFWLDNEPYLFVQAPIINPDSGQQVGTDVVLFQATRLQQMLTDEVGLGQTGMALLAAVESQDSTPVTPIIFPLSPQQDTALLRTIATALVGTIDTQNDAEQNNELTFINLPKPELLLTFAPIPESQFWVLMLKARSEVYAPLQPQLVKLGALVVVLSLLQTAGIAFLLRPLADRVLVRAEKLEDMNHKLQAACEQSPVSIVITNAAGEIEYVNPKFEQMTGYRMSEVVGKNSRILKSSHTSEEEYLMIWQLLLSGEEWHGQFRNHRKTGEVFWESASISPIKNRQGEITHFITVKEDITTRKKDEEALFFQANYDSLTGLPNRTFAFERLKLNITQAGRFGHQIAVLFLDLDQFKHINDSLGQKAGDQLLQNLAQRLQKVVRSTDTIARLGADEFLIVVPDLHSHQAAEVIANKILVAICEPFHLNNEEVIISGSMGIAFYPKDGLEPEQLVQQADTAMHAAKREEHNAFRIFTQAMDEAAQRHRQLENRLRYAQSKAELFVEYQPILDLATGHWVGAEALMRWQNADLGLVSPEQFIPIAEETGLINSLGRWILLTACQEAVQWQTATNTLDLAVNLSPHQLRQANFLQSVLDLAAQTGLPLTRLELEITENLLIERIPQGKDLLEQFRSHGIKLAVDDFGTGYSSLSYLRHYPFTTVKIDRSFVQDLPHKAEVVSLVKATIAMARELNLKVVAEGIETTEQLDFLVRHGCRCGQGYLLSPPLQAEAFHQLLDKEAQTPGYLGFAEKS